VLRGNQDLDKGNLSLGLIGTATNRSLDPTTEPYLHREAYSGGVDLRRRFAKRFEASGAFSLSSVQGSAAAIAQTQKDPVHLYSAPTAT
jgi:hypothetical protein